MRRNFEPTANHTNPQVRVYPGHPATHPLYIDFILHLSLMSTNSKVTGSMKEKRKALDLADTATKKEARIKHFHDRHLGFFQTLSNVEMALDLMDRVVGNSSPVAGNSSAVAGSPETPKPAGGGSAAAADAQHHVTKERAAELQKQLDQLKFWLDNKHMTRAQYTFSRIKIDEELSGAKRE